MITYPDNSQAQLVDYVSRVIDSETIELQSGKTIKIAYTRSIPGSTEAIKTFLPQGTELKLSSPVADSNSDYRYTVHIKIEDTFIDYQLIALDNGLALLDTRYQTTNNQINPEYAIFLSSEAPFQIGAINNGINKTKFNEIAILRNALQTAIKAVITNSTPEYQKRLDRLARDLYTGENREALLSWHFMNHPSARPTDTNQWIMIGDMYMDHKAQLNYNQMAMSADETVPQSGRAPIPEDDESPPVNARSITTLAGIFLIICLVTALAYTARKYIFNNSRETSKESIQPIERITTKAIHPSFHGIPPAVIYATAAILFTGALNLPLDYYTVIKTIAFAIFTWGGYIAHKRNYEALPWLLGIFAITFNPFFKVYLTRELWMSIDVLAGIFLLINTKAIQAIKATDEE